MTDRIQVLVADKVSAVFGERSLTAFVPLAGDASSRRYYRAHLSGPGAPPSVIVMELPAGSTLPLSSEELAIFAEGPTELPFLNLHRFFTRIGINVPRLYGHWEREGILLLEDLGDTALWDRVQGLTDADVIGWYQKAIDELLRIQIIGTAQRDDSCLAFQQRFDFKLYMWEFEHFIEWGVKKRPGAQISTTFIDQLRRSFASIADILQSQPPCLSHRDYHSWNLMITDDAIRVIDFQDALMAPAHYDLASLLNDRITDSIIQPHIEERLLHYYFDRRRDLGHAEQRDEFVEIYRLSAIQRDLKVVGRFYYLDLVKKKPGYLKFIPPTVRRLERNLAKAAQTKPILPILAEQFEAMQ